MPDPTMPKVMPDRVRQAIAEVLGWRNRPNPIDLYAAIRDALAEQEPPEASKPRSPY